ncbi:hypothetical protein ACS127_15070 [Amphibacillus sp. Q70]|uniref:hypothetical protein n=1 Tax=Amphibacillus sp. Q70 TaxID=3453416 RepID=UPI003F845FB2
MLNRKTLLICILIIILILFKWVQPTVTTLKYFPIDEEVSFSKATTTLQLEEKQPLLIWQVESSHQTTPYLNHNVGLLYRNGQLKGIQSKWIQNKPGMIQSIELTPDQNSFYQAISYHYLELHPSTSQIRSYYQMSATQLFIMNQTDQPFYSFATPNTKQEEQWAHSLESETSEQLNEAWTAWINYYDLNRKLYDEIPLIDLQNYQSEPLPGLTMTDTRRIIAQLWEGLYKNYILPNSQDQSDYSSMMPLILLDKSLDHLIVLFTDEEQNEQQLIQKLNVK